MWDLLPHSITQSVNIINANPHTEKGSHWLAVHFRPLSYTSYYFDSYGLPPFNPAIHSFDAIAPSGITTRYSYRVLLKRSAANSVACTPCTWIEFTPRSNSSVYLVPQTPSSRFQQCSSQNSESYAECLAEVNAATVCIKVMSPLSHLSFPNPVAMEALKGSHNETVIKEIALVADGVIRTLHFQAPCDMRPRSSAERAELVWWSHSLSSDTNNRYRSCGGIRTSVFIRHWEM